MPGDSRPDAPREARPVPTPKDPPPPVDPDLIRGVPPGVTIVNAPPQRRNEDYRLLREFNALTGVPVFARFVDASTLFAHYDKPASEFVAELRKQNRRSVKQRDGMLFTTNLLRDMKSPPAETLIPWAAVRRFRQSVFARAETAPNLADVCQLASDLTEEQMAAIDRFTALNHTVSVGNPLGGSGCYLGDLFRPLWVYLHRNPSVRDAINTERGIPLRSLPLYARDLLLQEGANSGIVPTPGTLVHDLHDEGKSAAAIATARCRIRVSDAQSEVDKRFGKPLLPTQLPPRYFLFEFLRPDLTADKASVVLFSWDARDPAALRAALELPPL